MSNLQNKQIAVLKDNPELADKKFYLCSMISPDSTQKHKVHSLKIHDVCATEEEGRALCEYYRRLDPAFDVYLGTVGKWSPWIWNALDVPNVEYANQFMTDLIREHRMNKSDMDTKWKHEVEQNLEQIRYTGTKEGQEEAAKKKEPAVSIWFKRQQLEATIKKRRDELEALDDLFHTNYTKAERNEAKKAQLPLSEPLPMQYELLGSDAGPSGTTASSSASGSGSSQQPQRPQESQQEEEEQQEAPAAA